MTTPDGAVWTGSMFPYGFWRRYLDTFSEAKVVARVERVERPPEGAIRADGPNVSFHGLPHYLGPWRYLAARSRLKASLREAMSLEGRILLRLPSTIATLWHPMLEKADRSYGVEVCADPLMTFTRGSVDHPLRPLLRIHYHRHQLRQCASASVAAYVTERYLQSLYPSSAPGHAVSDADLAAGCFVPASRSLDPGRPNRTLIVVGSLAQRYKGVDTLLVALRRCRSDGLDLRLMVVGDGIVRASLEALATELGLAKHVEFIGQLPAGDEVRSRLDQADLFALPSRSEGLPRAMIEAMARGLPCVGSKVGGIPELLAEDDLVRPDDPDALAAAISSMLQSPSRYAEASRRNLARSMDFSDAKLGAKRRRFLSELLERG